MDRARKVSHYHNGPQFSHLNNNNLFDKIKIRCTSDAPSLWCSTWTVCASALVTRSALVAYRCTYALPRCRTSQYRRTLFPYLCLCETILVTTYSMVWDWRVSKQGQCLLLLAKLQAPILSPTVFSFSSFVLWVGILGLGFSD